MPGVKSHVQIVRQPVPPKRGVINVNSPPGFIFKAALLLPRGPRILVPGAPPSDQLQDEVVMIYEALEQIP